MTQREYTLELGFARKPLAEQLSAQGLPFDAETIRHLDLDADAASRLKMRGVLSYTAGNKAYDAIIKRVWAEVRRADQPFIAWLAALNKLAAAEGCADYVRQTGAEAWRESFVDGVSPDEAWATEKSYAAEDAA